MADLWGWGGCGRVSDCALWFLGSGFCCLLGGSGVSGENRSAAEDDEKQSLADLTGRRRGGKVRTCALGLARLTRGTKGNSEAHVLLLRSVETGGGFSFA